MAYMYTTNEQTETILLANKILDRVNADPDDDLAMLSRQLLRRTEQCENLKIRVRELEKQFSVPPSVEGAP